MKFHARLAPCLLLSLTMSVLAETQEEDNQLEYEEAVKQLNAAITAIAEIESELIVESIAPMVDSLQPYYESIPDILHGVLEEIGEAIQLGEIGIMVSNTPDKGLAVVAIRDRSPAMRAGILKNDQVITIDGLKVADADDPESTANRLISNLSTGDTVRLGIMRDGKSIEIPIEVSGMDVATLHGIDFDEHPFFRGAISSLEIRRLTDILPEEHRYVYSSAQRSKSTIRLLEIEEELGHYFGVDFGVLVVAVPDDHDTLKPGDILLKMGDRRVASYSHAQRFLNGRDNAKSTQEIVVRRKGKSVTLDLDSGKWNFSQAYQYP